jgi:hypothetical protein
MPLLTGVNKGSDRDGAATERPAADDTVNAGIVAPSISPESEAERAPGQ